MGVLIAWFNKLLDIFIITIFPLGIGLRCNDFSFHLITILTPGLIVGKSFILCYLLLIRVF